MHIAKCKNKGKTQSQRNQTRKWRNGTEWSKGSPVSLLGLFLTLCLWFALLGKQLVFCLKEHSCLNSCQSTDLKNYLAVSSLPGTEKRELETGSS